MSINVFIFNHHPKTSLINTATGKIISGKIIPSLNVKKSYELGIFFTFSLTKFGRSLPGLYVTIFHVRFI